MLRLSKKTDYALIAIKHLAQTDRGSASAREIAELYNIPLELLAKVLQKLVRQGLLASHQGIKGGYHLARPAGTMSVADVVRAIDGEMTITACSTQDDGCEQYTKCTVRDPLWRIKDRILAALSTCTISELAADPVPDIIMPPAGVAVPALLTRRTHV